MTNDNQSSFDLKNAISGVLVIDKPVGLTSHDVVQIIRNGTKIRRAGHTGSLQKLPAACYRRARTVFGRHCVSPP